MNSIIERIKACFPEMEPLGQEVLARLVAAILEEEAKRKCPLCPRCYGKGRIPGGRGRGQGPGTGITNAKREAIKARLAELKAGKSTGRAGR